MYKEWCVEQVGKLRLDALAKRLMKGGNRTVADRILRECLKSLESSGVRNAEALVVARVTKLCPLVELVAKRSGGRVIQVPFPLRKNRSAFWGRKWLVEAALKGKGKKSMGARLAHEVLEIQNDRGERLKKRAQMHKQAILNKRNVIHRW